MRGRQEGREGSGGVGKVWQEIQEKQQDVKLREGREEEGGGREARR